MLGKLFKKKVVVEGRPAISTSLAHPYVIDFDGNTVADPAAWILANFGAAVGWERADVVAGSGATHVFRLVGFRAQQGGSCVLFTYVYDRETGAPVSGEAAIRYYPGAPALPGPIPPPGSAWHDTGIVSWTKADGSADWGMGHGDAYYPEISSGVSEVWVASLYGPSDLVRGLGWLDGTPYQRLAPVFEREVVGDDGENGNGEEPGAIEEELHLLRLSVEDIGQSMRQITGR